MGVGDLAARRPSADGRTAAPIAPQVEPQPSTSTSASPVAVDLDRRDVPGDAGDLRRAGRTMCSWLCGVVGDVAGAVLLLDAADAVHRAPACRGWPTDGPGSRRRYGRTTGAVGVVRGSGRWRTSARCRQAVDVGQQPRLGAVGQVAVGQQDHRRAVLDGDAGRLDRRRRSTAPGCGRRRSAAGASPWRPYMRLSRSACSVLVGQPGGRAAALDVDDHSGSSRLTARPMVSPLSARPGPLVVVQPEVPPNAAPIGRRCRRSRPRPGTCGRRSACASAARGGCRDAGVIGYEPRNSGSRASWPAATRPQASAVLPVMFVYVPGGSSAGVTS